VPADTCGASKLRSASLERVARADAHRVRRIDDLEDRHRAKLSFHAHPAQPSVGELRGFGTGGEEISLTMIHEPNVRVSPSRREARFTASDITVPSMRELSRSSRA